MDERIQRLLSNRSAIEDSLKLDTHASIDSTIYDTNIPQSDDSSATDLLATSCTSTPLDEAFKSNENGVKNTDSKLLLTTSGSRNKLSGSNRSLVDSDTDSNARAEKLNVS